MHRTLSITIALALVISAGLVHGQWTQRWTVSHAIEEAAARLDRLPMTLGDWQGQTLELNREQLAMAEIAGYVARRYEDRVSKDVVTVLLVCGSPGPISVHTPDVCYAAAGFELLGEPEKFSLPIGSGGAPAEFRNALLANSSTPVPTYLRILWSWSAVGSWSVPENPRLAFASSQVLYKMYLIRELTSTEERVEDDPSPRLLQTLLPELEQTLVPASSPKSAK